MQEMNRRAFIKSTAAVSLGVLASQLGSKVYAAGSDKIRVGLIGCGGAERVTGRREELHRGVRIG